MTRISIEIDRRLLDQAARWLGTKTTSETVNEALRFVVRAKAFAAEVEFAKAGGYDDLLDPEVMRQAWR